jgi:hypothetical protein
MAFGAGKSNGDPGLLASSFYNSGFRTPAEAQLAGEQFLKDFLDAIGRETDVD